MKQKILNGDLLDDRSELSLGDLSRATACSAEWVIELVQEGVLEPVGYQHTRWRFTASSLQRARTAKHLQRDLGINTSGVALALDLLDEIETLTARLRCLEQGEDD
jgi:chaperone modulatory protein CbpM